MLCGLCGLIIAALLVFKTKKMYCNLFDLSINLIIILRSTNGFIFCIYSVFTFHRFHPKRNDSVCRTYKSFHMDSFLMLKKIILKKIISFGDEEVNVYNSSLCMYCFGKCGFSFTMFLNFQTLKERLEAAVQPMQKCRKKGRFKLVLLSLINTQTNTVLENQICVYNA